MNNDFAMRIRTSNVDLHKATEVYGFNNRLVMGKADKDSYAEFMFNYLYVYEAIENALDKLSDKEEIKPFVTKEVYRAALIKKDLEFLLGDKVKSMEVLPSTKAYVARINSIARGHNPIVLVAHAYTRFLADLFGGRTISKVVRENYVSQEDGLNYFRFDEVPDMMGFVMAYRDKLNAMNLNEEMQEMFLNEVANAYLYNLGISTELEIKLYNKSEVGTVNGGHPGGHPQGMPTGHPGAMPAGHPHVAPGAKMPAGHPPIK